MKTVKTQKAGKAKIVPIGTAAALSAEKPKSRVTKPGSVASRSTLPPITHEMISDRARSIWRSKGCPAGQDEQNWHQAEMELRMERGGA